MRTTLTLDPDVAENLKKKMHEDGLGLKEALNQTLRAGLQAAKSSKPLPRFVVEPFHGGIPAGIDLNKIGQYSDELELEEMMAKFSRDSSR